MCAKQVDVSSAPAVKVPNSSVAIIFVNPGHESPSKVASKGSAPGSQRLRRLLRELLRAHIVEGFPGANLETVGAGASPVVLWAGLSAPETLGNISPYPGTPVMVSSATKLPSNPSTRIWRGQAKAARQRIQAVGPNPS